MHHVVACAGVSENFDLDVALLRRLSYRLYWHQFHTRLSKAQNGVYKESNLLCVPAESTRDNEAVLDAGIYPPVQVEG